MKKKYKDIEIMVGDVTDKLEVANAYRDVKGVFHLAALAQSMQSGGARESIHTNLIGSMNVLSESLSNCVHMPYLNGGREYEVDFVLGVSSDKAVQVSGPYGATKFLMERLLDHLLWHQCSPQMHLMGSFFLQHFYLRFLIHTNQ